MRAGEMVGDYEIVRPLGEGGMATVFVARDLRHEREVVLKAMPPYLNSPEMEARFRREIQSIASLSHPNVVKVLDFSVTSTLAWYVMPFVPALDLEKYSAELRGEAAIPAPSSFPRLRSILLDVASALAHCHERGVYHRDIKPQNILVEIETRRGILSDFGLARAADLTNLTKSREMLGTLRYMSPEMLEGSDVADASDVYQMALVTYEIFAGQLPLSGSNPYEDLKRRHTEPIPSIRTFNPQVAEELSEFVVRGMHADPAQRPATMNAFHEGLRAVQLEHRSNRAQVTPRSITMALSRSQELSAGLVRSEIQRRQRYLRLGYAGGVVALLAAAVFLLRSDEPRGLNVQASYQKAQFTSSGGPRFRLEVAGTRDGVRMVDAQPGSGKGWVATVGDLDPGKAYTACWVLEDGRKGAPVSFQTRPVAVAQPVITMAGGLLKVAFETGQPVRARLISGEETVGPQLDRGLSTQHEGEVPLASIADPNLRVALVDGGGETACVDLGTAAIPADIPAELAYELTTFNLDALFKEISTARWRKEERHKLSAHLDRSVLRRVNQTTDAFRPLAKLYFASPAVSLSKRMATYVALGKLYHIEGLLARENLPGRFDIPSLLGPLAPSPRSYLTAANITIQLMRRTKLKLKPAKELRRVNSTVYDTIDEETSLHQDVVVDREIRNTRELKRAELVLTFAEAQRDVYFSVEINGRFRLLFFPPNYAKISKLTPTVVLHHQFDPSLLEDGHNRFKIGIHVVADFPFAKGSGEIGLLELRAQ